MSYDFAVRYKTAQSEEIEHMKKIPLPIRNSRPAAPVVPHYPELMSDPTESNQPSKLGPMTWACNCQTPVQPRREQVFTRAYPTKVDSEGICVLCDHYAFRIEERILNQTKQHQRGRKR